MTFFLGAVLFVVCFFATACLVTYGYPSYRAFRKKRQIRGAFARYLSPALIEELADDRASIQLGGEVRQMPIMFCGISKFREIVRTFEHDLVALTVLMNRYNTKMTEVVLRRNGTIDKFMADRIMSFWNAPLDDKDHAANSCLAALEMMDALGELNAELAGEARANDDTPCQFEIAIGLEIGPCLVGNIGSEQRFDYSVMGVTPQIAEDLEKLTRVYGVPILIGEGAQAAAPEFGALEVDSVRLEGIRDPVRIFALLGDRKVKESLPFRELEDRQRAFLQAFGNEDREGARGLLAECRAAASAYDDLTALYDYYESRLA